MSKPARICGDLNSMWRFSPYIIVTGAALLLAGCSSSVSRFDYPIFGYGSEDGQPTGAISPRKPVYGSSGPSWGHNSKTTSNDAMYDRVSRSGNYSAPVEPVTRSAPRSYARAPQNYQNNYQRNTAIRPNSYTQTTGATPPPVRRPILRQGTGAGRDGMVSVRQGDTLYSLSQRHNVSLSSLKRANNISGNGIQLGQRLVLPNGGSLSASTHNVKAGETIYSISRQYGVSPEEIAHANSLSDLNQIKPGQSLTLPTHARPTAAIAKRKKNVRVAHAGNKSTSLAAPRKVRTQKITPKITHVKKKKKIQAKSAKPKKKIASINKPIAKPEARSQGRFRWPVRGRIISKFGPKKNGAHNDGINVAVPKGTSVKAVENGVVAYSGNELKGYGNLILVRHADNWVSAYAHNSKLLVKRGDKIKRGQIVAKAGRSGSVSQPQLHFELRKGSKPVNPTKYMAAL